MSTVQAPHCPSPQPYLVPVRFRRSRKAYSSISSSPACKRWSVPLTFRAISRIEPSEEYCRAFFRGNAPLPQDGPQEMLLVSLEPSALAYEYCLWTGIVVVI